MAGPSQTKKSDFLHQGRRDRLIKELDHDPYSSKKKIAEPSVCRDCGAVLQQGRWIWDERPENAHEVLCPACQRIQDRFPGGYLTLGGDFLGPHKQEIMNLIRNLAESEKAERPLKRMMEMVERNGDLICTFTDPHLARRIGEAVHKAYQGTLDFKYTKEDVLLRIAWHR